MPTEHVAAVAAEEVAALPPLAGPALVPLEDWDDPPEAWNDLSQAMRYYRRKRDLPGFWDQLQDLADTLLATVPDLRVAGVALVAAWHRAAPADFAAAAQRFQQIVLRDWQVMPLPMSRRGAFFGVLEDDLTAGLDAAARQGKLAAPPWNGVGAAAAAALEAALLAMVPPPPAGLQRLLSRMADLLRAGTGTAAAPADAVPPPVAAAKPANPVPAAPALPPPLLEAPDEADEPPTAWLELDQLVRDYRREVARPGYWDRLHDWADAVLAGTADPRAAGIAIIAAWQRRAATDLTVAASRYRQLVERDWAAMPLPAARRGGLLAVFEDDLLASLTSEVRSGPDGALAEERLNAAALATAADVEAALAAMGATPPPGLQRLFGGMARLLQDGAKAARPRPAAETVPSKSEPEPAAHAVPPAQSDAATDAPGQNRPNLLDRLLGRGTKEAPAETKDDPSGHMLAFALTCFGSKDEAQRLDPRAFALLRDYALWNRPCLPGMPGGPISLFPPGEADRQRIGLLRAAKVPQKEEDRAAVIGLVADAERAMPGFPLWLDQHQAVAEALGRLGAEAIPARAVVIGGVAALLARLPGLPAAVFEDGTPLADAVTRAWLARELRGGEPEHPALVAATEAAAAGRLPEAIGILGAARRGEAGREGYRLGLAQARLLLDKDRAPAAQAVLDGLDAPVGLAGWEPSLAAAAATLRLAVLDALEPRLRSGVDALDPLERERAQGQVQEHEQRRRRALGVLGRVDAGALLARMP